MEVRSLDEINKMINDGELGAPADPKSLATAWVNFDGTGTTGADMVIASSYNVSRVEKTNTGKYTIYFAEDMANGDYCLSGSVGNDNTAMSSLKGINFAEDGLIGSFKITVRSDSGSLNDNDTTTVTVHGGKY